MVVLLFNFVIFVEYRFIIVI